MRNTPNLKANGHRVTRGAYASDDADGNNGMFIFPATGGRPRMCCVVSDELWDHVSVSVDTNPKRCPTWEEMCWVKDLFFLPTETVVQFHPKATEYVNCHQWTLHLWRSHGTEHELPPYWMVGPKTQEAG